MKLDPASNNAWACIGGSADHFRGRRLNNPFHYVDGIGLWFSGERESCYKGTIHISLAEFNHQGVDSGVEGHIAGLQHEFLDDGGWLPNRVASLFHSLITLKLKDAINKK